MPLAQGQVLNNRYRIVNLLGQGGFGAVYRAWDVNLKRPCAVKENLDTSPEAQAQFEREALILAGLIHPNLARVTDHFFVPDQGQYLVMDFVEGEDLHQMIESSGGPISEQDAVRWVSQVCDALSYMHTQQPPIIHRDIKPANIKVTPEGKAMLVDFGIAKIYDPKLRTTVGARAVTPGYSPPEQYGQGKTDLRSDIFALGATMYTMLTARVPPDSVDVLTDSQPLPEPVHEINPDVSLQVSEAVGKAMQVKREKRFDDAAQFKGVLTRAEEPVDAAAIIIEEEPSISPVQVQPAVAASASAPSTPVTPEPAKKRSKLWVIVGGIAIVAVVVLGLVFAADNFGWFTPEEAVEYSEEGEGEIPMEAAYDSDLSGDLTLWHDYGEDDPRSDALDMLIERAMELAPELNIHAVRTDSTAQLYSAEGANGEGPDLLIANSRNLRSWVDEDLVLPLWEEVDFDTDAYQGSAVDSMIVYDELYGLPLSPFIVGTYYNRSLVAHPPEDVEQMMEVIMDESHLASPLNSYFLYGFFGAFGAHVLDEEGRCVAVETGGEDALWYLLDLQEAGAHYTEYAEAERLFLDWEKGLLINGPWVLGQYREIFGDELGFVPLPAGPGGPARPLLSYEGVYVNPHSENVEAALRLAEFLGSQEAAQVFSDVGLVVPARWDVDMPDPIQHTFFEAVDHGDMIVKRWEFENYWEPFRVMFFDVLEGGAPPEGALAEACAVMNELNGK